MKKEDFPSRALELFRFQAEHNTVYRDYVEALQVNPASVSNLAEIPFLPIRFFKSHRVQTGSFEPLIVFESSGTTGSVNSHHEIRDGSLYETSFRKGFELFYGPVKDWCIIGLLPSYLERGNSSLVYMVDKLIRLSGHPSSGFYLNEYNSLMERIDELEKTKQKTWLIGVSFALLDLARRFSTQLRYTRVIETGGMKGRSGEMVRQELHDILMHSFGLSSIDSEYGMTELLSQAYSKGGGIFHTPPWMKLLVRDEEDPLLLKLSGTGAINVIDLANIHSCSFIATDDAGRLNADGSFEVLGRMDGADFRGCSLMTL